MASATPPPRATMRIDKLLWFLRFAKTRGIAQGLAETGHIRRNGARIERAAAGIGVGDVLVIPAPLGVRVVEITALPARRGPPGEAQACYRTLDGARVLPIAAAGAEPLTDALKGDLQP